MGKARKKPNDLDRELAALRARVAELEEQERLRRHAQTRLNEHGLRLEHLVSASPAVLYTCGPGPDYATMFISDNVSTTLGYHAQDFYDDPRFWEKAIHPEDRGRVLEELSRVESAEAIEYEYRFLHADGRYVWLHDQVVPVRDASGKVVELIGSWLNVTSRRSAEAATMESANRYRDLFDQVPVGLFRTTPSGEILDANHAAVDMFGYPDRETLLGTNVRALYADPDERLDILRRIDRSGVERDLEIQFRRYDGTVIWVKMTARAGFDAHGTVQYCKGSLEDITARKQAELQLRRSESRFRELYESSRDGYAMVDMDGRIVECNTGFSEMVGYSPEELGHLTYRDLTPPQWHAFEFKILQEQVLTRGYSDLYQKEYRHKNGTVFPIELRTYLLGGENGRPMGMWAFVRDVTERMRAETARRESEERLRTLLNDLPIGVFQTTPDGKWISANPALARQLGASSVEELMTKPILGFWADPVQRHELLRRLEAEGEVRGFELQNRRLDGTTGWGSTTVSAKRNAAGEIVMLEGIGEDITERKRTWEALQESEATARALINAPTDLVLMLDPNGVILDANETAAKILGRPVSDLLGLPFGRLAPPEEVARRRMVVLSDVVASRQPKRIVDERQGRWFDAVVYPIIGSSGDVTKVAVVARDITERKQAELALRESEATARALINAPTDSVILSDTEGHILAINETGARRMGRRPEELIGILGDTLFSPELVRQRRVWVAQMLATGQPVRFEDERDGMWFDSVLYPIFDSSGKVGRFAVVARDITERKRVEHALQESEATARALINAPTDLILMLDPNGVILAINETAAKTIGRPASEFVGLPFDGFFPPEVSRYRRVTLSQVVASRKPARITEERSGKWFDTVVYPVLDPSGEVTKVAIVARDITERKQVEEALGRSERQLRSVFEGASEGIIVTDVQVTNLRYVNPMWLKLFGYEAAELAQLRMLDCHPEEVHASILENYGRILKGELSHLSNFPCRRKDGSVFYANISAATVEMSGENVLVAFFTDSTERRMAEEELRASERQLRALFEGASEGIVIAETVTRALHYVNPTSCKMFGYEAAELTQMGVLDLHPEEAHPRVLTDFGRIVSGELTRSLNLPCRRKDGSLFYADISGAALDLAGESLAVAFFTDMTERRKAEELLHRTTTTLNNILASTTEYAIAATDIGFRVVHYNPAAQKMFGVPSAEVLNHNLLDIHKAMGVNRKRVADALDTAKRDGRWEAELTLTGAGGTRRIIQPVVMPMRDNAGTMVGYILLARDITEQRQIEEMRARMESQLEHMHKLQAIGQLAAGVAHDFNSILMIVSGNAELLRGRLRKAGMGGQQDQIGEPLKQVFEAVERGQSLIQKLLAFGRTRTWRPRLLDLNANVTEICRMLEGVISKHTPFRMRLEPELRRVRADTGQIEQVLINLILNARDAMPDGGEITLRTANVDLDDDYSAAHVDAHSGPHVLVTVSDTGCGMDKRTVERIFEPFYTTKPVGKGTGLGLPIVYGIIKQAGGHITVESAVGKGSTFRVYLPVADRTARDASQSQA